MKGAARVSDATAHGGTAVTGDAMVLINKLPAVRVGDIHVCFKHGAGLVVGGTDMVLVGRKPLARVGDSCKCNVNPGIANDGKGGRQKADANGSFGSEGGAPRGELVATAGGDVQTFQLADGSVIRVEGAHGELQLKGRAESGVAASADGNFGKVLVTVEGPRGKYHQKVLTLEFKGPNATAEAAQWVGSHDGKTGIDYGGKATAAGASLKVSEEDRVFIGGHDIRRKSEVGADLEGVGVVGRGWAFWDPKTERLSVGGTGGVTLVLGLEILGEISVGKEQVDDNKIVVGSPDVLVGG